MLHITSHRLLFQKNAKVHMLSDRGGGDTGTDVEFVVDSACSRTGKSRRRVSHRQVHLPDDFG